MFKNEDWEFLLKKYKGLIRNIAYLISKKDPLLHGFDDSVQDLEELMLNVVQNFKRVQFTNKNRSSYEFRGELVEKEDYKFIKTKCFGQYLKYSLWAYKCSQGRKLQDKYFINNSLSLVEEQFEDPNLVFEVEFKDTLLWEFLEKNLGVKEKVILNFILTDQKSLTSVGLNSKRLKRKFKLARKELEVLLSNIRVCYNEGLRNI